MTNTELEKRKEQAKKTRLIGCIERILVRFDGMVLSEVLSNDRMNWLKECSSDELDSLKTKIESAESGLVAFDLIRDAIYDSKDARELAEAEEQARVPGGPAIASMEL